MSMLTVRDLSYIYKSEEGSFEILLPSLNLKAGETVALTGVSGCGKSTLLECLGLIRTGFTASCLNLDGRDLRVGNERECSDIRSALLGFMPQQNALIPFLKLTEDLKLSLDLAIRARIRLSLMGFDRKAYLDAGLALLSRLGIGELAECLPAKLSIGQQQRAAFVRALIHRPALLLIDEPTSALDPEHGHDLVASMLECVAKSSSCALIITHDLSICRQFNLRCCAYDAAQSTSQRSVFVEKERL